MVAPGVLAFPWVALCCAEKNECVATMRRSVAAHSFVLLICAASAPQSFVTPHLRRMCAAEFSQRRGAMYTRLMTHLRRRRAADPPAPPNRNSTW